MQNTLKTDTSLCSTCGQTIYASAEICPHCGVRQRMPPGHNTSGKNRLAAALLAIFLGSFGIHHFYLGQPFYGVLYLIFFWSAIPGIVGFIEGILYLTMSDERFGRRYGN